ncbi:MAG: ankyrin repeat domain-containing protein [Smithella sp.]
MKKLLSTLLILCLLTPLVGCNSFQKIVQKKDSKALKDYIYGERDVNMMEDGATLLMWASYHCNIEAVKLLLKRGAAVNSQGRDEKIALHSAATTGCVEVIDYLIDKGANIDALDNKGCSPLGLAAWYWKEDAVQLLLERGANDNIAINYLEKERNSNYNISLVKTAKWRVERGKTINVAHKDKQVLFVKTDIDDIPIISTEPRDNAYAVVIGIESYRNIPNSDYSRSDATLVKTYLKALGFRERNIDLITDEKATRTDIQKSLEAWLPSKINNDSTVIVYFSGHGAPEPSAGESYLVPYDGDPNYLPVTGYPLKRLYEKLGRLEAKEIIVILDSCFSGSGGRSVLAKGARPLVTMAPANFLSPNMAILSATQGNQISTSSPDKGHGIFTYYFLKAIKNGKGTLAEIYKYITPKVEDDAKRLDIQQSPNLIPDAASLEKRFSLRKEK